MAKTSISSWGYQYDKSWSSARRAMAQKSLDEGSALLSSVTTALNNRIQGAATLAAQAALKRVQAATKAKLAEADTLKIDKTA